jgi:hypothetical protein
MWQCRTALVNGVVMAAMCDTVADLPVSFDEALKIWRESTTT